MTDQNTITTPRLRLTQLLPQDEDVVVEMLGNPRVREYFGGPVPADQRPHRFRAYLSPPTGCSLWAIRLALSDKMIGLITLDPHHNCNDTEISYALHPKFWRQGYASEAVGCILNLALTELSLPCVLAETQAANIAWCALLEHLNMIEIDRLERFGALQIIYSTPPKAG